MDTCRTLGFENMPVVAPSPILPMLSGRGVERHRGCLTHVQTLTTPSPGPPSGEMAEAMIVLDGESDAGNLPVGP